MKNSKFYFLFTLAALFFLGSCSHTSQVGRTAPGELKYAQTTPKTDVTTGPTALQTRTTPGITVESSESRIAPFLTEPRKVVETKKRFSSRILEKRIDKTLAKAEQKIANTKVFAKVEKGKKATQIERNLKIAIVLIVIGAILGYFGGLIGWIGWVLVLIGLIFLLLWLLEAL